MSRPRRHELSPTDVLWLKSMNVTVPERLAAEVAGRNEFAGRSAEYESGWRDRDLLAHQAQETFIENVKHWKDDSKFWRRLAFALGAFSLYLFLFLAVKGG